MFNNLSRWEIKLANVVFLDVFKNFLDYFEIWLLDLWCIFYGMFRKFYFSWCHYSNAFYVCHIASMLHSFNLMSGFPNDSVEISLSSFHIFQVKFLSLWDIRLIQLHIIRLCYSFWTISLLNKLFFFINVCPFVRVCHTLLCYVIYFLAYIIIFIWIFLDCWFFIPPFRKLTILVNIWKVLWYFRWCQRSSWIYLFWMSLKLWYILRNYYLKTF